MEQRQNIEINEINQMPILYQYQGLVYSDTLTHTHFIALIRTSNFMLNILFTSACACVCVCLCVYVCVCVIQTNEALTVVLVPNRLLLLKSLLSVAELSDEAFLEERQHSVWSTSHRNTSQPRWKVHTGRKTSQNTSPPKIPSWTIWLLQNCKM